LQNVRDHGVIVEVMFHWPHRVKSEGLGHLGELQFLAVNFRVGKRVIGVLKSRSVTNVHDILL
jgi:hypothetical protein